MDADACSHLTCPVCFELTPDTLEECGHTLCHTCAHRWFQKDARCPMCRTHIEWKHQPQDESVPNAGPPPHAGTLELNVARIREAQEETEASVTYTTWPFPWAEARAPPAQTPESLLSRFYNSLLIPLDMELADAPEGVRVVRLPSRPRIVQMFGQYRGTNVRLQVGDVFTHINGAEVHGVRHAIIALENSLFRRNRVICTIATRDSQFGALGWRRR